MLKVSVGQSPPSMTSRKVHLAQELLLFSYSSIHLTSMEESPEEIIYISTLQQSVSEDPKDHPDRSEAFWK